MPDSQNQFDALPLRQKITAILFFIIGAFVIYEVIGMFRGKSSSSKPPAITKATVAPSATAPARATNPPATTSLPHGSPLTSKPLAEGTPPPPTSHLEQQEQAQNHYINTLNELQLLKLQREMAETSQAIMAAKLATVTAEKNISELLSPEGINNQKSLPTPTSPAPTPPVGFNDNNNYYAVLSVSMELEQWHAVLSHKNRLYTVSVGDVLPPDGSVVAAIDQKGVTLQQGGAEQKIPLTMTDSLPPPAQHAPMGSALTAPPAP